MVLHHDSSLGSTLIEHISKVYQRWTKSDGIYREAAKDVEFDWENLVCSNDLNRNPHSKLLEFVLWRQGLILSNQVLLTGLEN